MVETHPDTIERVLEKLDEIIALRRISKVVRSELEEIRDMIESER